MITLVVLLVLIIVLGLVWMKFKNAKNKRPEDRSALESIMATVSVNSRKSLEEAAGQLRTAEISKEEGIQKTKDAIAQLDQDFKKQIKDLMVYQSTLSRDLEVLKSQPSQMEERARASKNRMKAAQDSGKSQEVIALHKKNAIMYLDMKAKAIERISKAEKTLEEIDTTLEVTQATYENRKMILQDLLQEFKSFNGPISAAKFNSSLDVIKSLKEETVEKLAIQNAEVRASNFISGTNSSEDTDSAVSSGKYEDEFNNL